MILAVLAKNWLTYHLISSCVCVCGGGSSFSFLSGAQGLFLLCAQWIMWYTGDQTQVNHMQVNSLYYHSSTTLFQLFFSFFFCIIQLLGSILSRLITRKLFS